MKKLTRNDFVGLLAEARNKIWIWPDHIYANLSRIDLRGVDFAKINQSILRKNEASYRAKCWAKINRKGK